MGAFKVRGGLFLMSDLSAEERARGVVTASTGNHGQSIAYAAREFGVPATVWMPEEANPLKVASMRRLGAEVRFAGRDFDESRAEAERDAAARGARLVAPANDWRLIAGSCDVYRRDAGSCARSGCADRPRWRWLRAVRRLPCRKELSPRLRVIGVQAAGAPVVYETWRSGQLQEIDRADTFAEGLATRVAFSLPAQILWQRLDDFRLVTDAEMRRGILTLLERARVLAEGAGAAAPSPRHYAMREELAGQKVGIVVSGGNLTLDALAETLAMEHAW